MPGFPQGLAHTVYLTHVAAIRAATCATPSTLTTGEERREGFSEVEVSSLLQQLPVGELLAEGEAPILEAEDVQILVV